MPRQNRATICICLRKSQIYSLKTALEWPFGDHLYRLRVGDYRVIYQIDGDKLVVLVVHVGHRKDFYPHLKR
ncbi:MAG: type II toxin-antitoxin system RelE/ParE family toxin [Desulfuromonadales bacterium]|nr:type II toxin-antitoxin system RelE/ParE family toxin [Desulfuromonadales bacterium]